MNLIRMIRRKPEKLIFHCLKIFFERRPAEEICSPIHVGLIQSLSPISTDYKSYNLRIIYVIIITYGDFTVCPKKVTLMH